MTALHDPSQILRQSAPLSIVLVWVDAGAIAIPEIQCPFVWHQTQVRDLMDTMLKGFHEQIV